MTSAPVVPDDTAFESQEKENDNVDAKPIAQVVNPASGKLDVVYKNIEDDALIKRIKELEEQLEALMGKESVEADLEGIEVELDKSKKIDLTKISMQKQLLNQLLDCFNELLKVPYGSLGYLVKSNSEDIIKLYGVDSDEDYYLKLRGSVIRISSRQLENAVAASGRRFIGESGRLIYNPAEIPDNLKVSDHVIHDIIYAIHERLEAIQKEYDTD